jgi:hypothetical protein
MNDPANVNAIDPRSINESLLLSRSLTMRLSHRLLRNLHLATTPILGAFIYSRALRYNEPFLTIVQWGVFPLVASAGLALLIRPWLARRAAESKSS